MKLFLSSQGFLTRSQFLELVGKKYGDAKVGLVMNAVDYRTSPERRIRYIKTKKLFRRIGIKPVIFDLREYSNKSPQILKRKLQSFDLLWVCGGNCFYLRSVMNRSGFDKVIGGALKSGLVYAGESAGALVAGPTLKYIDEVDNPKIVKNKMIQGMKLTKIVPLPHWGRKEYMGGLKKAFSSFRKDKTNVIRLRDGEALLIVDNISKKIRTNKSWT